MSDVPETLPRDRTSYSAIAGRSALKYYGRASDEAAVSDALKEGAAA
jgi:hypothetical protein